VPKLKEITRPSFTKRTHWHPYILQTLSSSKFERVATKILRGEYILLKLPDIERLPDEDVPIIDPIKRIFL
jgi:hypothetical protein